MRYKFAIFLGLLAILLPGSLLLSGRILSPAKAQDQFAPLAVGNVLPQLHASHLLGKDQPDRILQMDIGLALRNQDQLNVLLKNLYDPSSLDYHQFLSVAQFTQQFSATAQQQQTVVDYLTQQGFTIDQTYTNRLLIDFSGPESLAEKVFNTSINLYQGPGGQRFFANASAPTMPAYIAALVTYVGGLDDGNKFYHPPIPGRHAPVMAPHAGSNCPTSGQSGSSQTAYIPSQFATAYNYDGLYNAGLQGEGQTVGVFELDGYSAGDIQAYTQCFGGGSVPLSNVAVDGFNGQPGTGAIEVELDIEAILSMAPHLQKLLVYEAPNTTQGYNDEFARIASDRTPVVSVSWGDCETNMGQQEVQQESKYFQEAAAQGQTILVAAGDSGSETCWAQSYNPALVADDPAAQPYATGVGGTTLSLNSNNSYQSEHVWNSGLLGGAGGGGLSQYWQQPSWQTGPGTQNQYSNGMRETPDVSLDADPATGYPVYCTAGSSCNGSGGWIIVGGTSAAAPMWASLIALANEQATKAGKAPLGFLNPALYKIGASTQHSSDFHDITPPGNSSTPSNNDELGVNGGAYPVTTGYDMATGWGTFNAANLADNLVSMD